MSPYDWLTVSWGAPKGERYDIGLLERLAYDLYCFTYSGSIDKALSVGFTLLPPFPARFEKHLSPYLWNVFADRIPSRRRSDTTALLAQWGVNDPGDDFEILAKSHGRRATDFIELSLWP